MEANNGTEVGHWIKIGKRMKINDGEEKSGKPPRSRIVLVLKRLEEVITQ